MQVNRYQGIRVEGLVCAVPQNGFLWNLSRMARMMHCR